jgi:outer membrane receptor for ferrienterochelin and colicins
MPKKLIILLAIALSAHTATGQFASLEGHITQSGQPQVGVTVSLPDLDIGTTTQADGYYILTDIPAGTHQVVVRYIGMKTIHRQFDFRENTQLHIDFDLQPDHLLLDQVVVSATRNEMPRYKSPVIVSTLTNRSFKATQSLNIAEGLNFTPGLRVENNCQNCGFSQVRMNGLGGPYSQILINSRPVFSALAGVYGLEMMPASMVDRVEVIRGAGSALYGGNAIAGTVNIITKEPVTNGFEVMANQAWTGLSDPDFTLSASGSLVGPELDRGLRFFGYRRDREAWDADGDGFSEMTRLNNTTIGMDGYYQPGERSKWRWGAYHINEFRRGGSHLDRPPHQAAIAEQLQHRIFGAHLSYERFSRDKTHKSSAYVSGQWVNRDSYYGAGGRIIPDGDTLTATDRLALNAYGHSRDLSLTAGAQHAYRINQQIGLTAGVEMQHNNVTDEMPGYQRAIDQQVTTTGSYLQLEYIPIDRLTLLLGGRYDRLHITGDYALGADFLREKKALGVFVPRLSAMLDLTESLKMRGSLAQGYRGPQAFDEDLHIETVGGAARFITLGEDLETERSNSASLSLNFTKRLESQQLNIVLEGFYTHLTNPFIRSGQRELPSGVSVITKRNGSGAFVRGLNLEVNYASGSNWMLQAGSTLQQALFEEKEVIWSPEDDDKRSPVTTDQILRTPDAYGYVTAEYIITDRWKINLSGIFTGTMRVPHVVDPDTEYTVIEKTRSFYEQNIKLDYKIIQKEDISSTVSVGVHNLFDSYQSDFDMGPERDASYIYGPMRPRTLYISLNYSF